MGKAKICEHGISPTKACPRCKQAWKLKGSLRRYTGNMRSTTNNKFSGRGGMTKMLKHKQTNKG